MNRGPQPPDVVKEQKRSVLQLEWKQVSRMIKLAHYYHDRGKSKCYEERKNLQILLLQ